MWTCVYCGETNAEGMRACEICARPRATPPGSTTPPAPAATQPEPPTAQPGPPAWQPEPRWQPAPPAAQPDPLGPPRPPAPRRPLWIWISLAVLLAAVGVVGVSTVPRLLGSEPATGPSTAAAAGQNATTEPVAESTPTEPAADPTTDPATEPTAAETATTGLVTVDATVIDSRAPGVADMFGTYFGGINDKDYAAVGSVLDPAGSIDPTDPGEMAALRKGTRSTRDSDITLTGLSDLSGGRLSADIRLRSQQDAGDGPTRNPAETCTKWAITYTLSTTADGAYLVRKSTARSAPC